MTHSNLPKYRQLCLSLLLAFLALLLTWTTLARAGNPGDLDTSFGGTGIITTTISSGSDGGFSVAIQPDNKIVVAGVSDNRYFAVARYSSDGSLDSDFNGNGIVTTSIGIIDFGFATIIQPDGKIVVAGSGFDDSNSYFAVSRYTITGSLDTGFNGNGIVTSSIGIDQGYAVALQPDGKIVVVGESDSDFDSNIELALLRYTSAGNLDLGFNDTGIVTTSFENSSASGRAVAIQPDGKIVVAGGVDNNIALFRYTITGSLDSGFNSSGIVTTSINTNARGNAVIIQPDGKIVVAGTSGNPANTNFTVARYNGWYTESCVKRREPVS